MDPALILALVEVTKMGVQLIADAQTGALTPEQMKQRIDEMRGRLDEANSLWEQAGKTAAARKKEGTTA
jgi:predicted transcriptional regulator